mmetsp:Transcript_37459/g.43604  ORF Transcript_37459/g.43604 Transcript_37459/m.43604 type:complete len:256 (-) Transcript_37459:130-897(-)
MLEMGKSKMKDQRHKPISQFCSNSSFMVSCVRILPFIFLMQQICLSKADDVPPYRDHRSDQSSPTMRFVDAVFGDEPIDKIEDWLKMKKMTIPGMSKLPMDVNFVYPTSMLKENAIMYASRKGDWKLVKMLLSYRAFLNVANSEGFTPIHVAATLGHARVVDVIGDSMKVEFEDLHDDDGLAPIHRACGGGTAAHTNTVEAFLNYGVPVNHLTEDGLTPLDIVRKSSKNTATEKILLKAGGKSQFRSATDKKEEL